MKRLSPTARVLLGLATLWPLVYMVLFFLFLFGGIALSATGHEKAMAVLFGLIFGAHLLTMLLIMGLTVCYIVHLFQNDRIPNDLKGLWAVILIMGNMVAMPAYFCIYVWKDRRDNGG